MTGVLINDLSGSASGTTTYYEYILNKFAPVYRPLVPAVAWQESCWRQFVERGGKLICWDDSCDMVIKRFDLPIKNVLDGLKRNEFYNPGSVVRLVVDKFNSLAREWRMALMIPSRNAKYNSCSTS